MHASYRFADLQALIWACSMHACMLAARSKAVYACQLVVFPVLTSHVGVLTL